MYPILYRKKTSASYLAALLLGSLLLRILCRPVLRDELWERGKALLNSEGFYQTALFLETGILPPHREAAALPTREQETAQATISAEPTALPSWSPASTETSSQPVPAVLPSEAAPAEADAALLSFTPEEAEKIQLRGNCSYEVDKTELLLRPFNWKLTPGPKILIIHSHSCESYTQTEGHTYVPSANYRTLDFENNMIAVGDSLTEELGALGVEVIHDRSYNDYPDYNRSYAVAREKIQGYLEQYPSITMVIDLHRDALDKPVREVVEWEGQSLAPLMLVIGTDEGGLSHPHWEDNLSCGLKLQALGNREVPELFKRPSFRRERFNGDLTPGSLIVEVGSTENTLPEAKAAMPYLARWLAELLKAGEAEQQSHL
ncbi:MAG: stage II sporulation protein P, partial [Oscillospiraceae bacterium]|nr:stage II sporulation protein P [Oscillospiraceae bacterium]